IKDSGSELVYQYWIFYVYNKFGNEHYGDWEFVYVFVDRKNGSTTKIVGSAHNGTHTKVAFANNELEFPGIKNVRILVEVGSHANAPDGNIDGLFSNINLLKKSKDISNWSNAYGIWTWSVSDKLHGVKVEHDSPYYDLRPLDEIKDVFRKKYSEDTPLLSKKKSPALGMIEMRIGKSKFYALPLGGDSPQNAWLKDEYSNPQKVVPLTPSRIASGISNKVTEVTSSAKHSILSAAENAVSVGESIGNNIVHLGATVNIPNSPFSVADLFSENPIEPLTLKDFAGQNALRGDLIEPKYLLSGSLGELISDTESNSADDADKQATDILSDDSKEEVKANKDFNQTGLDVNENKESAFDNEYIEERSSGEGNLAFEYETEVAIATRVIDGDTIELKTGQIVRYIGINAPELPDNCFAKEATQRNGELAAGKQLIFIKGPTDKDKYDRLLRFAWADENKNGKIDSEDIFINLSLVEGGYAYSFNFGEIHAYDHRFESAEEQAKRDRRGLWGDACKKEEEPKAVFSPETGQYKAGSGARAMPTPDVPEEESSDSPTPKSEEGGSGTSIDSGFSDDPNSTSTDYGNSTSTDPGTGNSTSTDFGNATTTDPIPANEENQPESSPISINEIQLADSEFVELYNNSSSSISMANYYFSYYSPTKTSWNDPHRSKKFPDDAEITRYAHYLIGLKDFPTDGGNPNADWQPYSSNQFNNSRGTVAIFPFDPSSTTSEVAYLGRVDAVGWDDDFGGNENDISLYENSPAAFVPADGQSISRNDSHDDTDNNSIDFSVAGSPTPRNSDWIIAENEEADDAAGAPPLWQMYQKDARRSGFSPLANGPNFSTSTEVSAYWVFEMERRSTYPAVVGYDGRVYSSDVDGFVYSINIDGSLNWKFDPRIDGGGGEGWSSGSLALSNDSTDVYSMYADTDINKAVLYRIRAKDGILRWKYIDDSGNNVFTPAAIDSSNNIYFTGKSRIYSISKDATLNWITPISSIWLRAVSLDKDGYLYTVAKKNNDPRGTYIFKIKTDDGSIVWEENSSHLDLFNPVSVGENGIVYTGGYLNTGKSGLYAIDKNDGSIIWFSRIGDVTGPNPAFDSDGNIYLGVRNSESSGALYKVNADGDTAWSFVSKPIGPVEVPAITDSMSVVYMGSTQKFIYAINSVTGREIWSYELSGNALGFAIGDGVLYASSKDGKIYAFK
ncbi:MAG: hypothetical protein A2827_00320, partial [Candidatus Spechtbacteria bacterium RIFCSPHIGHO2_01_FULL_43_30]